MRYRHARDLYRAYLEDLFKALFAQVKELMIKSGVWKESMTMITRPTLQAAIASLGPSRVRPEEGDCAACPARHGCRFFCPSLGMLLGGDPALARETPATSCVAR